MGAQEQSGGNPRFTGPMGIGRSPAVERERNRTADIRWGTYVAPISETEHWVKNPGNPQLYRVGSAGPVVFSKGQKVQLSSSTGIGPEIILGFPGSKKGGSTFAARTFSRSFGGTVPDPEPELTTIDDGYTAWRISQGESSFTVTATRLERATDFETVDFHRDASSEEYVVPGTYVQDSNSHRSFARGMGGWLAARHVHSGVHKFTFMAPDGSESHEVEAQKSLFSEPVTRSSNLVSINWGESFVPNGGHYYLSGPSELLTSPPRIQLELRMLEFDLSSDSSVGEFRVPSPEEDPVVSYGLAIVQGSGNRSAVVSVRESGESFATAMQVVGGTTYALGEDTVEDVQFPAPVSNGAVNATLQRLSWTTFGGDNYLIGRDFEFPQVGHSPATVGTGLSIASAIWWEGGEIIEKSEGEPFGPRPYDPEVAPDFITYDSVG